DGGVEGEVHDGGVEVVDRAPEPVDIDPEPIGEWVEGVSRGAGNGLRIVLLGPQQRTGLGVEELEGDAAGLREDLATVLRVGIVAEVSPLVDEPPSLRVDDDPERVALPGQLVRQVTVAAAG